MKRSSRHSPSSDRRASPKPPSGHVRIIGGEWRGTRLPVHDRDGLRPTPDRVRETLFNWLQPVLPGARVLDLFAGTGALGLEALSRGAAEAVLIERDPALANTLRETVTRLRGADRARVVQAETLAWLRASPEAPFDIVFLDPPYAADLWAAVLQTLSPWLAEGAWLYLESPQDQVPPLDARWRLHREGRTRETRYAVYRHSAAEAAVTP